jgi:MFS family permease
MFFGWRVVAGSFVAMMFVLGFFTYTFTLFVTPLREEFGVGLESVMYSLTLGTVLGLAVSPISGILIDHVSVRLLMSLGCILVAAGFWIMSQSASIGMFNVAFALTFSLGNNIVGIMSGSAVVSRWFARSRGRALGITTIGTSVGGIAMPALGAWWIAEVGWRGALENFALIALLIVTPWIWLNVRDKPADLNLLPDGVVHSGDTVPATGPAGDPPGIQDIIRLPVFWLIALSVGLLIAVFSSMLSNLSPYAIEQGASPAQASALIMMLAITGLIGKLLFGFAADRFNLKWGMWAAQGLVGVAMLLMASQPPYAVIAVAAMCLGFATGGLLPVWNSMLALVFGVESFGRAMGAMGPVITLLVTPAYVLVGRLHDIDGDYTRVLLLFCVFIVLGMLLLVPVKLPGPSEH